ncbi:DUF2157 domain-containing protein [Corticibacter populi]|uniref:DUF2157 domain-containing protein n=1 Tax=Corticibacter populi TaxID=1550736 RepID=A0A3M6QSL3_9BURK|nr:DUF2157 domain-containing protein [Corticibacter populi]RMX05983.1 DUF2157 domain-containing protein [Corticibacter populi]RZS30686.1 putative membrane protein DUF2157 [Corticibacter populi]
MEWSFRDLDTLWRWHDHGRLDERQLALLVQQAPLRPGPATWREFLAQLLLWAGCLALASGLIFFFAYNWDALGRFAQLAMAAGALLLALGLTLATTPGGRAWRAGCLAVALCMGALLALIGQKYQTGADIWQLFGVWAALMLPVALLARSGAVWLLWALLLNLTLWRWLAMDGSVSGWAMPLQAMMGHGIWMGLTNGLLLLAFETRPTWLMVQPQRWLARCLLAGLLLPLASDTITHGHGAMLLFCGVAALAWWHYARRQLDAMAVALVYAATLYAIMGWLFNMLLNRLDASGLLLLTVLLLAGSSMCARHVLQLWRQQRGQDGEDGESGQGQQEAHA